MNEKFHELQQMLNSDMNYTDLDMAKKMLEDLKEKVDDTSMAWMSVCWLCRNVCVVMCVHVCVYVYV